MPQHYPLGMVQHFMNHAMKQQFFCFVISKWGSKRSCHFWLWELVLPILSTMCISPLGKIPIALHYHTPQFAGSLTSKSWFSFLGRSQGCPACRSAPGQARPLDQGLWPFSSAPWSHSERFHQVSLLPTLAKLCRTIFHSRQGSLQYFLGALIGLNTK